MVLTDLVAVERELRVTISISDEVYEGLHLKIGRRRISQFIERLARPHVVAESIEAAYRDMATSQAREQEALEWCEGVIADSFLAESPPRGYRQ